jgi:hypothetical protein
MVARGTAARDVEQGRSRRSFFYWQDLWARIRSPSVRSIDGLPYRIGYGGQSGASGRDFFFTFFFLFFSKIHSPKKIAKLYIYLTP